MSTISPSPTRSNLAEPALGLVRALRHLPPPPPPHPPPTPTPPPQPRPRAALVRLAPGAPRAPRRGGGRWGGAATTGAPAVGPASPRRDRAGPPRAPHHRGSSPRARR